jgi:AraC family transcriptional regulator, melibiose operon regulatory protein
MQITEIITDEQMKELIRHGSVKFPLQVYLDDMSKYDIGYVSWHWHNEIEFVVVTQGTIEVFAGEHTVHLQEKEGAFINKEVMHMAKPKGSENAVMFSVVMNPLLLSDGEQSIINEKYVIPLLNCPDLPLIKLQQAYDWQAKCIQGLQRINDLFYDKQFAYELLIRSQLCEIWYLLLENNLGTIQSSHASSNILTSQQRMKQMILYIHHHYTEAITLEDIAKSAHISKSECYRCFQRFLGLKPFEYLMEYRLANAARLLSETNISVIDIAQGCGYNSQSYFTKMFKIYYHITPLQYRLKNSSNKYKPS